MHQTHHLLIKKSDRALQNLVFELYLFAFAYLFDCVCYHVVCVITTRYAQIQTRSAHNIGGVTVSIEVMWSHETGEHVNIQAAVASYSAGGFPVNRYTSSCNLITMKALFPDTATL